MSLRSRGPSAGSERRQFTRIMVQTKLELISLRDNVPQRRYTGLSRDISINGLGFLQFSPLALGEQFIVCMPHGKTELLMVCATTFCTILADGIFGIGAQFISPPEPEMMDALNDLRNGDRLLERIKNSVLM